jgi:hypothetical protein
MQRHTAIREVAPPTAGAYTFGYPEGRDAQPVEESAHSNFL